MNNKVDKGFELIYWNLSYRRKFIRTLWLTPFCIIVLGILIFFKDIPRLIRMLFSIILIISYIWQLIYTYTKWKKEQ